MRRMTTSQALHAFSATLAKASKGGRVLLVRRGKPVAALVSVEDLELLQKLEDQHDAELARAALSEIKEQGTVSWDDLKAATGL